MARSPIKIYSENPNKTAPQTQQQQPTNKKGMDRLAQSARRFIEQDDKLQLSVGEEKDVVSKVDVLCREIKEAGKQLAIWGSDGGHALKDITSKLGVLSDEISESFAAFGGKYENSRKYLKAVRVRDNALQEIITKRKDVSARLEKLKKDNKPFNETEKEYNKLNADYEKTTVEYDAFRRKMLVESLREKYDGYEALGQRLIILAQAGKKIADIVPSDTYATIAELNPPWKQDGATAKILADAMAEVETGTKKTGTPTSNSNADSMNNDKGSKKVSTTTVATITTSMSMASVATSTDSLSPQRGRSESSPTSPASIPPRSTSYPCPSSNTGSEASLSPKNASDPMAPGAIPNIPLSTSPRGSNLMEQVPPPKPPRRYSESTEALAKVDSMNKIPGGFPAGSASSSSSSLPIASLNASNASLNQQQQQPPLPARGRSPSAPQLPTASSSPPPQSVYITPAPQPPQHQPQQQQIIYTSDMQNIMYVPTAQPIYYTTAPPTPAFTPTIPSYQQEQHYHMVYAAPAGYPPPHSPIHQQAPQPPQPPPGQGGYPPPYGYYHQ